MKKRYISAPKPFGYAKDISYRAAYTVIVSADSSTETDIRAMSKLVFDLNDFFAVFLTTLGTNSVVEIVSAAVGALFQSGLFQLPYAGTSGVLSCLRCFTLRYCHCKHLPIFSAPFPANLFFEKVRQTCKSWVNFLLRAFTRTKV